MPSKPEKSSAGTNVRLPVFTSTCGRRANGLVAALVVGVSVTMKDSVCAVSFQSKRGSRLGTLAPARAPVTKLSKLHGVSAEQLSSVTLTCRTLRLKDGASFTAAASVKAHTRVASSVHTHHQRSLRPPSHVTIKPKT